MTLSIEKLFQGDIVPIDKPVDWTSFDVVNKLRFATKIKKVGHAGTLDPFATGLLLVCFAKATKQVETLVNLPKEYIARFKFGIDTDSHDIKGKILAQKNNVLIDGKKLRSVLLKYIGEIQQIPPMFSALKIGGKKLYEYARAGQEVRREPRTVVVSSINIIEMNEDECLMKINCSKGTYIRSLARDIGNDLGTGAILTELRRTKIGDYHVDDAFTIDYFIQNIKETKPSNECLSGN